ncbi:HWE histidine kinase domain-containing protein [Novosphingobium sp. SG720]|uniref:HWE histidine kinase domain-containing protein n=1 Tax=Novosphingobium sp. SG720 TaxID=2586998 RepID=UPI001446F324|nr:HWE histidine kinase domain-containing protein [Novosphingobium sp. SG720]NKJ41082.1 light-regulated signal transduction histidine kinase (bacteriophytochrome) [Novosphingobium sp. SG720]
MTKHSESDGQVPGNGAGAFAVDLSNCDREPIHVLGIIQPFGFLVAVTPDWMVARVSENLAEFTGTSPETALGQPLSDLIDREAIHTIRNRLTTLRGPDAVERIFGVPLLADRPPFDVAVHFSGREIVIEAEPAAAEPLEATSVVRSMIARLQQVDGLPAFLREGARQVRAITGFDRVMVYRFDAQESGEVVAESVRHGVDSFLGLHYPASDIPSQARKLYLRNTFRVIADVGSTPVPLMPQRDPDGKLLDQSLSLLRAVSPIHVEYLRNMGVCASLSISIVVGGKLWGLFACHHYAPRLPSMAARSAAELFGQMFSLMLDARENAQAREYEARGRAVTDRLLATVAQDNDLLDNPQWLADVIGDAIPADGIGVHVRGQTSLVGLTPNPAQFEDVVRLLNRVSSGQVFATETIAAQLPSAAAHGDVAAGMLAIPLSREPRDYIVLFRAERLREVRWGGKPEKEIVYGPNGPRLTPRKSFEAWAELVKGTSQPFTPAERRVAEALRVGMLEVLVRLAETAGAERARASERQELLIAELNHRVRNILSLIRGLIAQTRDGAADVAGFITTLDDRIRSLARAHDQITADRWGPARLADLVEIEAGAYLRAQSERVVAQGENVLLYPTAYVTIALVIHELMTNAVKYGALAGQGTVHLSWERDVHGGLALDWQERDGPPVATPTRRGFGSTIIERSIPYDLGGTAQISYLPAGVHARFTLPEPCVAGVTAARHSGPMPISLGGATTPLDGCNVLLVEDSMIIALDGEDALRELGAAAVSTAPTVRDALRMLDQGPFHFALLDFNLGVDTSAAVADKLIELGVPFAFATGYGEGIGVERWPGVPVINKPYGLKELRAAVSQGQAAPPADSAAQQ